MAEAMQKVKAELGEGAVLLRTRSLELSLDGRAGFEITAAEESEPVAVPRAARAAAPAAPAAGAAAPPAGPIPSGQLVSCLVARGVHELLARRLAEAWQKKSRPADAEALLKALARLIPVRNDLALSHQPLVIAFVGPTGVGKTTTLAKLAAQFVLDGKMRVQLLTADTHRIAAVEQLEAYARLLGTDLRVGFDAAEIRRLREESEAQIVLLDTPGIGPMDDAGLRGLKGILEAARPHHAHLCLSAGMRTPDLRIAAARFAALGSDRLLFTKLDESGTAGQLLTALAETQLPASYWTCGQVVPGDIHAATGEGMARLILGGVSHAESAVATRTA